MTIVSRLTAGHAEALLAFERENRAYFSASVPDRGDDYFTGFGARHRELLAEQEAGLHHFHVVEDADGTLLGRINLVGVRDGSAELGYRIGERAAGRGPATRADRRLCVTAVREYGLPLLRAGTTLDNAGSRPVLARTGFQPVEEVMFGDRPGRRYVLDLRGSTLPAP
ncbi:GNAT family N-acetyltransferase [Streptomyces sp. BE282]|uniref:GNAT family N-acetyltransferase n=1 Tax=Streptomyces TaxID=1883 RepID=UPI000B91919C|nr:MULTISPECIES: GNAT family N-acetyltransferase [Streptomyces]MBK3584703.1 GNAT family N-acetyltransferase [Streptomyces sp. MBT57]MBK5995828.1 GNAT family N-acetyltransferase [Streptomyces sp. MBT58]MEE1732854.1 GNAT family N-acetyltransferase [Streptomyces sp. BE282]OXY90888.1 GNAT family N-acetyltransferase [Streptomyces sp. 2R]WSR89465.1 GNAT family N-acetyltransferase [Streptomyces microflavus]